jgi:hypothetical protein
MFEPRQTRRPADASEKSCSLTLNDEVIILAYRWRNRLWLDDSLLRLIRLMPQLSRSALYQCLERYGLSKIGKTNISPPPRERQPGGAIPF